jgi:hypothetical protein
LEVAYFSAEKSLRLAAFAAPAYLQKGGYYAGLLHSYDIESRWLREPLEEKR